MIGGEEEEEEEEEEEKRWQQERWQRAPHDCLGWKAILPSPKRAIYS